MGANMKIRPLHDKILISPIKDPTMTKSGLYVPETSKGKPTRGRVEAVGPGKRNKSGARVELQVEVGDVVHYPMFVGTEVHVNGEEVVIIEEGLIMVLEDTETS